MDDLGCFWEDLSKWSQAAFGSDATRGPKGPLKHLIKEAEKELLPEITDAFKGDLVEYADLLFLVFDATRRAGYSYEELGGECFRKLEVNRARTWQTPLSPDEAIEHVRS